VIHQQRSIDKKNNFIWQDWAKRFLVIKQHPGQKTTNMAFYSHRCGGSLAAYSARQNLAVPGSSLAPTSGSDS